VEWLRSPSPGRDRTPPITSVRSATEPTRRGRDLARPKTGRPTAKDCAPAHATAAWMGDLSPACQGQGRSNPAPNVMSVPATRGREHEPGRSIRRSARWTGAETTVRACADRGFWLCGDASGVKPLSRHATTRSYSSIGPPTTSRRRTRSHPAPARRPDPCGLFQEHPGRLSACVLGHAWTPLDACRASSRADSASSMPVTRFEPCPRSRQSL
jgi:hypothetical protein